MKPVLTPAAGRRARPATQAAGCRRGRADGARRRGRRPRGHGRVGGAPTAGGPWWSAARGTTAATGSWPPGISHGGGCGWPSLPSRRSRASASRPPRTSRGSTRGDRRARRSRAGPRARARPGRRRHRRDLRHRVPGVPEDEWAAAIEAMNARRCPSWPSTSPRASTARPAPSRARPSGPTLTVTFGAAKLGRSCSPGPSAPAPCGRRHRVPRRPAFADGRGADRARGRGRGPAAPRCSTRTSAPRACWWSSRARAT